MILNVQASLLLTLNMYFIGQNCIPWMRQQKLRKCLIVAKDKKFYGKFVPCKLESLKSSDANDWRFSEVRQKSAKQSHIAT